LMARANAVNLDARQEARPSPRGLPLPTLSLAEDHPFETASGDYQYQA
jgi:hypothetical protein